jgi:transposase-like protein
VSWNAGRSAGWFVLRHVEEASGNVAATCRYYGISRQCYYGWLRRYEADGLEG